jgi:LysR family transcriptional regulator, carnitine catabolism transcriptional activator
LFALTPTCGPVEQTSTAIGLVRRGLGVTLTSSSGLAGVDIRGLKRVPIPGNAYLRHVGLIHPKDARPTPAATALMELAREHSATFSHEQGLPA